MIQQASSSPLTFAHSPMNSGSITYWIEQIKEGGDSVAEEELWERYFWRLAALARKRLRQLPASDRDMEDVALSALNSFFMRAERGEFSQLHDRTDLWHLLARITVRKSIDHRRIAQAMKRAGRPVPGRRGSDKHLLDVALNEPTPDMLVAINEECQRLLGALDKQLQPVARMKLEGYTNQEIAERLGRVERTVERKLDRIRQTWLRGLHHESAEGEGL